MYPVWSVPAAVGLLVIWFLVLSFYVFRQGKFLSSLFPKSGERDIRKKFEEITKSVEDFKIRLKVLDDRLESVSKDGLAHIQKVELLRYNPYNDTGGDQSFTVCFLDKKGSGIVVTSLHARSGTRVFAKDVSLGKSNRYKLSKEEEEVIKRAMSK